LHGVMVGGVNRKCATASYTTSIQHAINTQYAYNLTEIRDHITYSCRQMTLRKHSIQTAWHIW